MKRWDGLVVAALMVVVIEVLIGIALLWLPSFLN
jgi:hypothetical protein